MKQGVSTHELRKLIEAARSIACVASLQRVLSDLVLTCERLSEDAAANSGSQRHVASSLETVVALVLLAYADQTPRLHASQHEETLKALLQLPAPLLVSAIVRHASATSDPQHDSRTSPQATQSDWKPDAQPSQRVHIEAQLLDALLGVLGIKCDGAARTITVPTPGAVTAEVRRTVKTLTLAYSASACVCLQLFAVCATMYTAQLKGCSAIASPSANWPRALQVPLSPPRLRLAQSVLTAVQFSPPEVATKQCAQLSSRLLSLEACVPRLRKRCSALHPSAVLPRLLDDAAAAHSSAADTALGTSGDAAQACLKTCAEALASAVVSTAVLRGHGVIVATWVLAAPNSAASAAGCSSAGRCELCAAALAWINEASVHEKLWRSLLHAGGCAPVPPLDTLSRLWHRGTARALPQAQHGVFVADLALRGQGRLAPAAQALLIQVRGSLPYQARRTLSACSCHAVRRVLSSSHDNSIPGIKRRCMYYLPPWLSPCKR